MSQRKRVVIIIILVVVATILLSVMNIFSFNEHRKTKTVAYFDRDIEATISNYEISKRPLHNHFRL